jgi:cytoskeletal protein RodZ
MVEEGEYDTVSQKIYYFGYIRNLARYLKLDEEIVLRYLIAEIKIDEKSLKNNIDNADKNILSRSIMSGNSNNYKKNNYNSMYLVIFSIITLLSFGLLIKYQSSIKNDPITFTSAKQNIKL